MTTFLHLLLCKRRRFSAARALLIALMGTAFLYPVVLRANQLHVASDIAPVYSLVSMVAGNTVKQSLLLDPRQSPHHAALKPSQVKAMKNADLLFAVSQHFSPALTRYLHTLPDTANVVFLDQINFGEKQDPHTWMNPANVIRWLNTISDSLTETDPDNAAVYASNKEDAVQKITQLHAELRMQLEPVKQKPFMVYHDAYHHFASGFDLAKPIAITLSDARAPGAATIAQMRAKVNKVSCVFSEALHDDAIVDTVTDSMAIKRGILDPLGSTLPVDEHLYVNVMINLVNAVSNCLADN